GGFDATHARQGGAFRKPEWLLFECVYNVGHADLAGWPAERITAPCTAAAIHQLVLAQQFKYLADCGLTQPQYTGQIRRTEHTVRATCHVCKHQCAVINDFANAQHPLPPTCTVSI